MLSAATKKGAGEGGQYHRHGHQAAHTECFHRVPLAVRHEAQHSSDPDKDEEAGIRWKRVTGTLLHSLSLSHLTSLPPALRSQWVPQLDGHRINAKPVRSLLACLDYLQDVGADADMIQALKTSSIVENHPIPSIKYIVHSELQIGQLQGATFLLSTSIEKIGFERGQGAYTITFTDECACLWVGHNLLLASLAAPIASSVLTLARAS